MYFLSTGALSLSACLAQVAQVGYQQFLSRLQSDITTTVRGGLEARWGLSLEQASNTYASNGIWRLQRLGAWQADAAVRQTDRQTDRQTAAGTACLSLSSPRQHLQSYTTL